MGMLIIWILNLYKWILVVRVLISWVDPNPYNPIVRALSDLTDPVLNRARRIIPPIGGTIDISPILVFFVISLIQRAVAVGFYG